MTRQTRKLTQLKPHHSMRRLVQGFQTCCDENACLIHRLVNLLPWRMLRLWMQTLTLFPATRVSLCRLRLRLRRWHAFEF